jgi:hypothetical protein
MTNVLTHVSVAATPTPAVITEATARLNPYTTDGRHYAYAVGYLSVVVRLLAAEHRTCRDTRCMTCTNLRDGLAMIAALDAVTGGAR